MLLLALAGLPGTGKSTLARAVAAETGAAVLDKDRVRAAAFGDLVAHDTAQDDLVFRFLLEAALDLARRGATRVAILDGRTFTRPESVDELRRFAARHALPLRLVECTCPAEVARARLAADGAHPARDRTAALHDRLAARAVPVAADLRLETSETPLADQVAAIRALLARE